jgi:hypothetical protein
MEEQRAREAVHVAPPPRENAPGASRAVERVERVGRLWVNHAPAARRLPKRRSLSPRERA